MAGPFFGLTPRKPQDAVRFRQTEGADVGLKTGPPVSPDYMDSFKFNGKIEKVTIDLKDDKTKAADKDTIEKDSEDSRLKKASAN